jgi:Ca2+-binding RTX toxin-like protein
MTVYDGTTGVDTFTGTSGDDVFSMTNDIGPTQDTLHGGDGNDEFFYYMNDYSAGTPPYSPLAQIYGDGGQNSLVFDNSLSNDGAIPAIDMTGCSIFDIQTIDIEHGGTAAFNASQFRAGLIPWNATIEIGSGYFGSIEIDGQDNAANMIDASGFVFQEDSGVGGGFTLVGGSQADTLIANAQSIGDYLVGGDGDDTYVVYGATGIQETAGQGTDTVEARASYTLAAGVSIEVLETASASATTAINLTGNAPAQRIVGNAGKNTIDGGGGADVLVGGAGNDTYIVYGGETIQEVAGEGADTVRAHASYKLAAGSSIELLETANASATTAINLTGNALAQRIVGNIGRNTLDGGGGADVLVGGGGNDTYVVYGAATTIQEAAGEGTDTVKAHASYKLAAGVSIELLETANASATTAINLTGNAFAQRIVGSAGKNTIDGGGGDDVLVGGGGDDTFVFSTKLGAGNIDQIKDFNVPADTIALSHTIFSKAGTVGALSPKAFVVGAAAANASERIVYNAASGALYYDPDGAGHATEMQFATLAPHLALTAADFRIV